LKTNYILIDFENVQPDNLYLLKGQDFKVMVFVGDKQSKVSFDLAAAMQSLGERAEYIKIEGNGSNALDFHIAFHIGLIAANDKSCFFYIISKDTGFDPLIRHLKTKKIFVKRAQSIAEIPLLKISSVNSTTEKAPAVPEKTAETIVFLIASGAAKPRTIKTLANFISARFHKKLDDIELQKLISDLVLRKIVIDNGGKISYQLPEKP
jgi:PIN domain